MDAQCHQIDFTVSAACLCCRQPKEDGNHLLVCLTQEMKASRGLAMKQFWKFIEPVKTAPVIMNMMVRAMEKVMAGGLEI